ncbi:unnamed protein product [Rotaria sp. Silwood1]|nr:unnamed protein product [Rotaria sp. Silwood1]CAF3598723.1 unnamed protein product [Rotaria sp. Silwood1]CAF4783739.1 unnamed protein product [Rotaria sp. Silwood1]
MFHRTKEQMSTYITKLFEVDTQMRNQLTKLLPNIRSGSMKEIDLTNLLNNCDLSLTNKRSIDEWIQLKTKEINELYNFQKDLEKQSHICLLTCSFVEVQKQFTSKFILRLIFHLTEKSDSPSMKIFQCFDDKVKNSTNQYTKTGSWFNENNIKTIKKQILSFIRFVELNSSKTNIKFIVNEEYADEFQMKKGVTCILYQNGIPIDFEIPSEPGQPYATNVSDHSLTLCWSKPIDGSQSIQHYKVYRNNCLDKAWKLLLTTDDTILSVNISDLSNGRYQFKIQGVTLVGDTLESDASDEIFTPLIDDLANTTNPDVKKADEFTKSILNTKPSGNVTDRNTTCHILNKLLGGEDQQCLFFDSANGINLHDASGNLADIDSEDRPFVLKLKSSEGLGGDNTFFDARGDKTFNSGPQTYEIGPPERTKTYTSPTGWTRYGLKVLGKSEYKNDDWLHPFQHPGNWYRAFHGTGNATKVDFGNSNANFDQTAAPVDALANIFVGGFREARVDVYGSGVYCSPNPVWLGNSRYVRAVELDTEQGKKKFMCMLQVAVNPDGVQYPTNDIWVTPKPQDIRPYGILIKEV